VAGAIACGAATRGTGGALPRAGSPGDDGTGYLAHVSRGEPVTRGFGGDTYGGNAYGYAGGDVYGYGYGGDLYGYGGDLYGAYAGALYGGLGYAYPQVVQPPAPVEASYIGTQVANGGVIEGIVTWTGSPKVPATLAPLEGSTCTTPLPNPTLQKSTGGGVAYTLVYLADIRYGKTATTGGLGGILEQQGCAFAPHMQIAAPIGVTLQLENEDPVAHAIKIRPVSESGRQTPINVSLRTRREHDLPLVEAGVYEVTCETGHPGAIGWVVVPRHPYFAVTDDKGYFRLDDVPPGEYTVVAWHEPVVTEANKETGALSRGNAIEQRSKAKVVAGAVTQHNIDLR
jgi:hypothetical protein